MEYCDAAFDSTVNGRFGPFVSVDTKGGELPFVAGVKV